MDLSYSLFPILIYSHGLLHCYFCLDAQKSTANAASNVKFTSFWNESKMLYMYKCAQLISRGLAVKLTLYIAHLLCCHRNRAVK